SRCESATRTRSEGRAPPRRIRGGDGRETSWRAGGGEAERAVPVQGHAGKPAPHDGVRADVEQRVYGARRAPRRKPEGRPAGVVHPARQLEYVRRVTAGSQGGLERGRRNTRRDRATAQRTQAHKAGRHIGGAAIALV